MTKAIKNDLAQAIPRGLLQMGLQQRSETELRLGEYVAQSSLGSQ